MFEAVWHIAIEDFFCIFDKSVTIIKFIMYIIVNNTVGSVMGKHKNIKN